MISVLIMAMSTSICIFFREFEDPVMIGMTLTYILQLQDFIVYTLYALADVEKNMVNIQRCVEMSKVPQERLEGSSKLPISDKEGFFAKQWPKEG